MGIDSMHPYHHSRFTVVAFHSIPCLHVNPSLSLSLSLSLGGIKIDLA